MNDCILIDPSRAAEPIIAKCDCGEFLASFGAEVTGSMSLTCPACGDTSTWMSICTWGQVEPEDG